MKKWYVNFLSPYVNSSISSNYMVDVDIYKVCLKSNATERIARELAKL
jgi:hypothetical protein